MKATCDGQPCGSLDPIGYRRAQVELLLCPELSRFGVASRCRWPSGTPPRSPWSRARPQAFGVSSCLRSDLHLKHHTQATCLLPAPGTSSEPDLGPFVPWRFMADGPVHRAMSRGALEGSASHGAPAADLLGSAPGRRRLPLGALARAAALGSPQRAPRPTASTARAPGPSLGGLGEPLRQENITAALYSSKSPHLAGALRVRGNWLGCLERELPENRGAAARRPLALCSEAAICGERAAACATSMARSSAC